MGGACRVARASGRELKCGGGIPSVDRGPGRTARTRAVINLVRAEWRKVTTIKLGWGMLLGALALAALGVVAQIASNGSPGTGVPPLTNPDTQKAIAASASS